MNCYLTAQLQEIKMYKKASQHLSHCCPLRSFGNFKCACWSSKPLLVDNLMLQLSAARVCYFTDATHQQNCSDWFMTPWMCWAADAVDFWNCFWTMYTSSRNWGSLMQALFCLNPMLVTTSSCQSLSRKLQPLQWGKIWRGNLRCWWERWRQRQTRSARSGGIGCRWVTCLCSCSSEVAVVRCFLALHPTAAIK